MEYNYKIMTNEAAVAIKIKNLQTFGISLLPDLCKNICLKDGSADRTDHFCSVMLWRVMNVQFLCCKWDI